MTNLFDAIRSIRYRRAIRAQAKRARRARARRQKHIHTWEYSEPVISGWRIATCTTCGQSELA